MRKGKRKRKMISASKARQMAKKNKSK